MNSSNESGKSIELTRNRDSWENNSVCGICLDDLSSKRSITLNCCSHSFHRTCAMQWFESGESFLKHGYANKICCTCRRDVVAFYTEDGFALEFVHSFERDFEKWRTWMGETLKPMDKIMMCNHEKMIYLIDVVTEERRLAQRNGKSDAYIDDIDQEMMQLRKRYLAVKSLRRIITKKTEKTEKGRMMGLKRSCEKVALVDDTPAALLTASRSTRKRTAEEQADIDSFCAPWRYDHTDHKMRRFQ